MFQSNIKEKQSLLIQYQTQQMNKLQQLITIKTTKKPKEFTITETLPTSMENCLVRLLEIKEERNKANALINNNIKFPNPEMFADTSNLWERPELIARCNQLFH